MKQAPAEPVSLACAVLTVSDTRGPGDDTSGNLLAQSLAQAGHQCVRRDIVRTTSTRSAASSATGSPIPPCRSS